MAVARVRGLVYFGGPNSWGSAPLHPRLYSAARIRGLTCFDALSSWGSAPLHLRLYSAARIRGLGFGARVSWASLGVDKPHS